MQKLEAKPFGDLNFPRLTDLISQAEFMRILYQNFDFSDSREVPESKSRKISSIFEVLLRGLINEYGSEGYAKLLDLLEDAKGKVVRLAFENRVSASLSDVLLPADVAESDTQITMVSRIDPQELVKVSQEVNVQLVGIIGDSRR